MPATRTAKHMSLPKLEPPSPLAQASSSAASSSRLVASPLARSPSTSGTVFPIPDSNSPTPKRPSHHKKRPPSHIPRPPNAFILFRANFIRDRHLHSTSSGPLSNVSPTALSTIVGFTWRNLPEEERQIWVEKARIAREEHKLQHPSYRYQPLPTAEERAFNRENKRRVKEENIPKPDVERCREISRLLVEGHRGKELEDHLALFDQNRATLDAAGDGPPHPVRSASLPTPPRRRNSRRPRARSTSDSPPAAPISRPQTYEMPQIFDYESPFVSSPEPSSAVGMSLLDVPEHTMPELTYDAPSPSSINLPEPQEAGVLSHSPHNIPSTVYPRLPDSRPHTHSFQPSYQVSAPSSDPFRQTFSTFTSWEQSQPRVEEYFQYPYLGGVNDPATTGDAYPSHMTISPPSNAHPYASSIPPFELYHTLKSFEQPFPSSYEHSKSPKYLHDFDHELCYDHPEFRILSVDQ